MSKASRKKHQQRLHKATIRKYDQVKLADAIIDLCKPFANDGLGFVDRQNLVTLAVTAWNLALSCNLEERRMMLRSILAELPVFNHQFEPDISVFFNSPPLAQDSPDTIMMMRLMTGLMQRKDELYPNDERHIVDYDFKPSPKGYQLHIKSLIPKRSDA